MTDNLSSYQAVLGPSCRNPRIHLISEKSKTTRLVLCETCTPTNAYRGIVHVQFICQRCLVIMFRETGDDVLTPARIGVQDILSVDDPLEYNLNKIFKAPEDK